MTSTEQSRPDGGMVGEAGTAHPDSMILLACDGVAVVILRGDHSVGTADALRAFLHWPVTMGCPVVVDLTDVGLADSSTFGVFIAIDKQLRTSGRCLILQVNEESRAYWPMTLMGLYGWFKCAPSRDAALALAREPVGVRL